jgi:hypothetical protein
VFVTGKGCSLYGASLNYGSGGVGETVSAVGVYRSDVKTATSCPKGESAGGLTHPECWPTRRVVDVAGPGRFLDKEWMDVGRSGTAGEVVWVAYGDLGEFNEEGNEESGIIKAVRCRADLSACTAPITLSTGQRVAEYPSVTIGPDGRTYITWERCTARVQETICEDPKIMLTGSADQGRTWSTPRSISAGGDNYFPELDVDPATGPIVGAWYTNRFDPIFHNRQDVELVRLHNNGTVARRQRVTQDLEHRAWVHYNANERHVALLGEGLPVPQQDNYLTRLHE